MKTYYEMLGVETSASADAVKYAFRRLISRYHPDKVEHLGPEFKEIASARAAELTEAYRILVDQETRRQYDDSLRERTPVGAAPVPPVAPLAEPILEAFPPSADPSVGVGALTDRRTAAVRATSYEFIRREAVARLREAVVKVTGYDQIADSPGFDGVFVVGNSPGMFRQRSPELVVLVKFTPSVDAQAVRQVWGYALRASARYGDSGCILLIGHLVASPSELSQAIADERRKALRAGPVLVPVDVRDWEALFPPEAPARLRAILRCLRAGAA